MINPSNIAFIQIRFQFSNKAIGMKIVRTRKNVKRTQQQLYITATAQIRSLNDCIPEQKKLFTKRYEAIIITSLK